MHRLFAVALFLSVSAAAEELPVNPDVTQETIGQTICRPGWAKTVRPFVREMQAIKRQLLAEIGEPVARRNQYQLDHIIPLTLGGHPIDRRNLKLQPIDEARQKDPIEVCLSRAVCRGAIPLAEARAAADRVRKRNGWI